MAQNNSLLWLLKFNVYDSTQKSKSNRYIPQKGYDFLSKFHEFAVVKNIELIYCGRNGPFVMNTKQTDVPIFDWDMTIVTSNHNNSSSSEQLKQSKAFIKLKQEFGISKVYNVSYRIDESNTAKTEIPNMHTVKIPKRPYPSMSYEWLANSPNEAVDRFVKLCKIKNQPFMMLNLMQIVNKKQDEIYHSKVMPLLYGVGGRPGITGQTNDYWTQVLLVYYPNTKAFWEMVTSYHYVGKGLFKYKYISTKDVFCQMTIPLYCDPRYACNNVPSKL
eukprot:116411_1